MIYLKTRLSIWLTALALVSCAIAQTKDSVTESNANANSAVTVESTTSSLENVTLASDVKWTITVHVPEGCILPPAPLPSKWGNWVVASSEIQQTSPTTHEFQLVLRPTKIGKQVIPAWPIYYQDRSGKPGYVEVKPLEVNVISNLAANEKNLNGLESDNDLLQNRKKILPYIFYAIAAIIIIIFIWSAFFNQKKSSEKEKTKSPYELAMERMKTLLESGLAHRDVKLFFVELTGIVREFIERTTLINAPELTTEEFLHQISQGNVFSDVEQIRLKHFLESADMVKFAKYDPGEAGINEAITKAEDFICIKMEQTPGLNDIHPIG